MEELLKLKQEIQKIVHLKNRKEGELKQLEDQYRQLCNDLKNLNIDPANLVNEIALQRERAKTLEKEISDLLAKIESTI